MLVLASGLFVAATAPYFVGFGTACFLAPAMVDRFLTGFATSARAHYVELALRMLVGGALILRAPAMQGTAVFESLGWILVVTTAGLACLPWKWHRQIAEKSVPRALRYKKPMGAVAVATGLVLILALTTSART